MIGATEQVTIYNKYLDPTTKKTAYAKSMVSECYWERELTRNVQGSDVVFAASYLVMTSDLKAYLPSDEWAELTDKTGKYTVRTGDLVARGAQSLEISVDGVTESEAKRQLGKLIFTVQAVNDTTQGYKQAPHIEIVGV